MEHANIIVNFKWTSSSVRCSAGYYPKDGPNKSNLEAQIDMIDESLRWAGIDQATEVCIQLCSLLVVILIVQVC